MICAWQIRLLRLVVLPNVIFPTSAFCFVCKWHSVGPFTHVHVIRICILLFWNPDHMVLTLFMFLWPRYFFASSNGHFSCKLRDFTYVRSEWSQSCPRMCSSMSSDLGNAKKYSFANVCVTIQPYFTFTFYFRFCTHACNSSDSFRLCIRRGLSVCLPSANELLEYRFLRTRLFHVLTLDELLFWENAHCGGLWHHSPLSIDFVGGHLCQSSFFLLQLPVASLTTCLCANVS